MLHKKLALPRPIVQAYSHLALADIQAKRARVVVLEVVEGKVTLAADLVADSLSSSARARGNRVRVARSNGHGSKVGLLARLVGVGGLLAGRTLELGEVDLAGAGNSVGRSLEILLLWEQEDDGTGLARVRGGDVEVEDRASVAVDLAVVGCAICLR